MQESHEETGGVVTRSRAHSQPNFLHVAPIQFGGKYKNKGKKKIELKFKTDKKNGRGVY